MSRCQQYIASVHISCQISYHHDYRQPRHNVVERLDTYWFMICCQKCIIWHHRMLMFAYMVHIGRVSVDYISSKAPDMGSPPYVDDMLTYI